MFSVLGSNLTGTILFCDASVAPLKDTKGSIVNIISTAAFTPRVNETVYCGAKWGARGYTEALRLELKPFGVRVLGVYPGGMDTDFWKCTHLAPPDASKFMSAHTVADMIISNITHPHPSGYVSDLIINRG
jgi:short-subunit dehydrogenase